MKISFFFMLLFKKNDANKNYNNTIIVFIFLLMFLHPSKVVSQTSNNTSSSPPPSNLEFPSPGRYEFSPAMSMVFVIVVVIFFLVGCFSVFGRHCIDSGLPRSGLVTINGANRRPGRTMQGLEPNLIDTFPIFIYSDVKKVKIGGHHGALECAICLNEFKDDETLRMLPKCCHVFHPECIDTWLISHVTCPVCRANLVPVPGETGTGTDSCDDLLSRGSEDATTRPTNEGHGQVDGIINETERTIELVHHLTNERQNVGGKFPRSHSTGHSLIQLSNDYERFTLRLPQEVQKKLIKPDLRRAKSNLVFPSETSAKKGLRSSSVGGGRLQEHNNYERFDHESRRERWGFTAAPPFFTRSRSFQTPVVGGDNHKSPYGWLFGGSSSKDEVGERSFAKLIGNSPV